MQDHPNKAKSLFLAALEGYPPEQWPAFLDEACAGDVSLRTQVERLLRARARLGSFHESPPPAPPLDATADEQPVREGPGEVIGAYKLLEQIGEGASASSLWPSRPSPCAVGWP
jgi:serine/threonine-protein kinase